MNRRRCPAGGCRSRSRKAARDGLADVALVLRPVDDSGLDGEPLLTEPVLVAMAAADPLAARTQLCLADLAGRSLPNGAPAVAAFVRAAVAGAHHVHAHAETHMHSRIT
ncbi:LysR substrate-binding domain-containing protein [Streptomyces sviceus]|uniref:LysR substrate-binding domain-containing protein n=1 Tax=Streptomyces sviceus TaxID=285530 RepID=UPI0036CD8410